MTQIASAEDILHFWFKETDLDQRFNGGEAFDQEIWFRFQNTIEAAKKAELWTWRLDVRGRLAEIIVLDQFSRNVYRGDPRAFSSDDLAVGLSQELVKQEDYSNLTAEEKQFALMPFMHSESLKIHEELALTYFKDLDDPDVLKYEYAHLDQIKQFGRYPFRNDALGRESTEKEKRFMETNKAF